jgi:hypothetical protein
MSDPATQQEAEGIRAGAIWWVGAAVIVLSGVLVAIAWWLVVPPSPRDRAAQASPLEHGLIDRASGGAELRAAGEQQLERTQWVDRKTGVVRIPIDRAIDAVVADPRLIGARPSAVSENGRRARPGAGATPRSNPGAASDATLGPGGVTVPAAVRDETPREVAR